MPAQDKQIVEARMQSYDSLLESDPEIQQKIAESQIQGQRRNVMVLVEARFPALVEIVQQHVVRMSKEEQLDQLTKIIALAPDEKTARWAINTLAA